MKKEMNLTTEELKTLFETLAEEDFRNMANKKQKELLELREKTKQDIYEINSLLEDLMIYGDEKLYNKLLLFHINKIRKLHNIQKNLIRPMIKEEKIKGRLEDTRKFAKKYF